MQPMPSYTARPALGPLLFGLPLKVRAEPASATV
jgi:hypothetical protein